MEQIHLKVMQELNKQLFERIGKESDFSHIWTAYLCSDNYGFSFEDSYNKVQRYSLMEKHMHLKWFMSDEPLLEASYRKMHEIGKSTFRKFLTAAMQNEFKQYKQNLHFQWVYLAYSYLNTPNFEEKLILIQWAQDLEIENMQILVRANEIDDNQFQKLYQEALNAYNYYTKGIC